MTAVPLAWLAIITTTATWQKVVSPDVRIGFLAAADQLADKLAAGTLSPEQAAVAPQLIFNQRLDAALAIAAHGHSLDRDRRYAARQLARRAGTAGAAELRGAGRQYRGGAAHETARLRIVASSFARSRRDDAYERYLAHHAQTHAGRAPLDRREFYMREQQQKWRGV